MFRCTRSVFALLVLGFIATSCLSIDPTIPPRNLELADRADGYDYAPTVMHTPAEDVPYKLWFCAQDPMVDEQWRSASWDVVMYAESSSPNGPWSSPTVALRPTEITGSFDEDHTCDPSVVESGGNYYLYYGGLRDQAGSTAQLTHIGMAKSTDGGRTFTRAQIQPIVSPFATTCNRPEQISQWQDCYGAGQPTVVRAEGWFYMVYYDDTGIGGHDLFGGLYMIRSRSPFFTQPEHLVGATTDSSVWKAGVGGTSALLSPRHNLPNVDMMYITETREFLVLGRTASFVLTPDNGIANGPTSIDHEEFEPWTLDINNTTVTTQDGYGLLRSRSGHSLEVSCMQTAAGVLPMNILDVYIAAGAGADQPGAVSTWDLVRQRGYFQQERNTTSC